MDEVDDQVTLADALAAEFDKQTAEPEENTEIQASESDDVTVVDDETVIEETEVKPPEHWSEDDQKVFMDMDDSGREWALRLETNAHKGIEEKSKELKQYHDAFEPYKHLFPVGSESQVIQQLLNAQSTLQKDPVEGIKWLMKSYGVDEKQFVPTDASDEVYVDPDVKALRDEIDALKSTNKQSAQAAEENRQRMMLAEIQKVQDEADEDGNLLRPHFQAVQGVMAGLMQSGRANGLEDAYQQAVWAVPEYRDSEVERIAKDKAEKELADKTKEADKSASAGKNINGKSNGKEAPKETTLSDSLSENYEKSIRGELNA